MLISGSSSGNNYGTDSFGTGNTSGNYGNDGNYVNASTGDYDDNTGSYGVAMMQVLAAILLVDLVAAVNWIVMSPMTVAAWVRMRRDMWRPCTKRRLALM